MLTSTDVVAALLCCDGELLLRCGAVHPVAQHRSGVPAPLMSVGAAQERSFRELLDFLDVRFREQPDGREFRPLSQGLRSTDLDLSILWGAVIHCAPAEQDQGRRDRECATDPDCSPHESPHPLAAS